MAVSVRSLALPHICKHLGCPERCEAAGRGEAGSSGLQLLPPAHAGALLAPGWTEENGEEEAEQQEGAAQTGPGGKGCETTEGWS